MSSRHGAGMSNVGHGAFYEAGDQRNDPQEISGKREPFKEGQAHSHQQLDSKDDRSIANKLAAQERRGEESHRNRSDYDPEAGLSKQDPRKPATLHGNAPSKGAQVDADLQAEDEQRLREKGFK